MMERFLSGDTSEWSDDEAVASEWSLGEADTEELALGVERATTRAGPSTSVSRRGRERVIDKREEICRLGVL